MCVTMRRFGSSGIVEHFESGLTNTFKKAF